MINKEFWPDKKLLHKDDDDDVLIYNIRRALPRYIKRNFFENTICAALSEAEKNFIQKYYKIPSSVPVTITNYTEIIDSYMYSNLPLYIPKNEINLAMDKCKKNDREFILSMYNMDNNGLMLKDIYINENDELRLLYLLNRGDLKVSDYEKTKLSWILEPFSELLFPSYYYCTMYNDTKHYYYYRKDHEHVPGVMLIEVARQAGYAYTYIYMGFKRGEVTISWGKSEMVFPNYTQSNFPVRIMIEDISEGPDDFSITGVKRGGLKITMFQNFKIVAIMNNYGPIIHMDVFNDIRTIGIEDDHLRFYPTKYFSTHILLVDDNKNKYKCELKNISAKGFCINSKYEIPVYENSQYTFFMHIDCVGDIYGTCEIKWQEPVDTGYDIGVQISMISDEDKYRLKEAIKKYAYLIEKREVL